MSFMVVQLRRDTAANWTAANPVLRPGEMGIELGAVPRWKVGDGTTAWNLLPYGFRGDTGAQGPVGLTGATGPQGPEGPQPPLSSATPAALGTAAAGSATAASRGDHVHPIPTTTLTGDLTGSGAGSVPATVANNAISNAKLADVPTATIKGRITAAVGDPEDLTAAQARTVLNVADGATANATDAALRDRATHTGTQPHTTITGLGTASTQNTGTSGATVPLLNASVTFSGAECRHKAAAGDSYWRVSKPASANFAGYVWENELNVRRWDLYIENNASDRLILARYDTAGNFTNEILRVSEIDGAVTAWTNWAYHGNLNAISSNGRHRINGTVGLHVDAVPNVGLWLNQDISGSVNGWALQNSATFTSSITGFAFAYNSAFTVAANTAISEAWSYRVQAPTLNAGSSIGPYFAFGTEDVSGSAGTTVGFLNRIAAGSNKWGFLDQGGANNAFAGHVRIGSTLAPTVPLDVTGNAAISGSLTLGGNTVAPIQPGTATGQLARWNNTAARYEPVTLNTLTDAADDAAAATAGVAVGGLYRTGSILKTRIA